MLNNVSLVGRLTKDPEVKVIGDNTEVCNFVLAVNRDFKNKEGETEADFIQCQAWNTQAKFIGSYVKKGHLISVTGRITTRNYEVDGVKKYVTEVNLTSVSSLESKPKEEYSSIEEVKAAWKAEWNRRSVGLDKSSQENLTKELTQKYQPMIDRFEAKIGLPF